MKEKKKELVRAFACFVVCGRDRARNRLGNIRHKRLGLCRTTFSFVPNNVRNGAGHWGDMFAKRASEKGFSWGDTAHSRKNYTFAGKLRIDDRLYYFL